MKMIRPLIATACFLVSCTGCAPLSRFAYSCGDWLSPGNCVPGTPESQMMVPNAGGNPYTDSPCGPKVDTSGYSQDLHGTPAGGPPPFAQAQYQETASLQSSVSDLSKQISTLNDEMKDIRRQMAQSQYDLIATRDVNVQAELRLQSLTQEVRQWHEQLAVLQRQLHTQNEQRAQQWKQIERLVDRMSEPTPP